MLTVKNISKSFDNVLAVDNLSFTVNDGEIFGLLGSNGAGKTTTFRIILSLLDPDNGEVFLDDEKIDYNTMKKIGFVTEERSLMTKLTVKEQILFYGHLKGMTEEEILKKLDDLLEKFEITNYKNRKIKELSKGNQQKVQFISAIINDPKLLILDEPFTGLDPVNVKLMKDEIYNLKNKGCIIIFSSHQMEHIEEFCEKLVIMLKGKTVLTGYLKDIKNNYPKLKILIKGQIDLEELKGLDYIVDIKEHYDEILIKVKEEKNAKDLFNIIKKYDIAKFDLLDIPLSEIFIEKVGDISVK